MRFCCWQSSERFCKCSGHNCNTQSKASNADGSKKQEERKKGEEDVAVLMGAPVAVAVVLVVVGTRLNLVMDEGDKSVVSAHFAWSLLAFGFHSVLLRCD